MTDEQQHQKNTREENVYSQWSWVGSHPLCSLETCTPSLSAKKKRRLEIYRNDLQIICLCSSWLWNITLHCFMMITPEFLYPFLLCFFLSLIHSNSACKIPHKGILFDQYIHGVHTVQGLRKCFVQFWWHNQPEKTQSSPHMTGMPAVFERVSSERTQWSREIRCCCGHNNPPEEHRHWMKQHAADERWNRTTQHPFEWQNELWIRQTVKTTWAAKKAHRSVILI